MQPEICKPSHEGHQTSSFKKYPPNLTAFKNPADAGPQVLLSRIYLKMNMQPELCKPSHEAHQTSSLKKYLPPRSDGLQKSSRRWTTGFRFSRIYLKIHMQPEICKPSHEAQQTSSVQKVPPKSDGLQKIQLMLGRRINFQWFIWKQIYSPKCVSLRTKPTKQVRSKSTSQIWRPSKI